MANKLKVLMCSEASFLNSGFGTYTKEVLSRLHKTNKYEIAEFASYGFVNDPRDRSIDWIYYANAVREDDPRHKEYSSRQDNQFGRWRFEKVLLDFKPDVVIDVRDYWMSAYQSYSPFRKYFHWILMPTVDSEPQQEDWIDTFLSADAVFTYSDWGAEVLNRQSSGKIKYIDTTAPGVDLKAFNLKDINSRLSLRQKMGIPSDAIVFGTVMRNQKRKLFPELFITFRELLDKLEAENKPEIAKKLYLHIHTSYPDMGWDIPELLKESRIANKVLITYSCKNCKNVLASTFCGPIRNCPKCLSKSMGFTSVGDGVSSETLSDIYNCFDIYIQYAICEGFGMPQVEAGACGLPIITVDYSAMKDVIKYLDATPIPAKTSFKELETKAIRVYPDNDVLCSKMLELAKEIDADPSKFEEKRKAVRELTEKNYDWDITVKKWEKYLDQLESSGYRADWNKVTSYCLPIADINSPIPVQNNFDALTSILEGNLKNFSLLERMNILSLLRDWDYGFQIAGPMQIKGFGSKDALENLQAMIASINIAENFRNQNNLQEEDFISYAKMKAESV
jgi:glycosyltransferase involved in cell wall biosynthesis